MKKSILKVFSLILAVVLGISSFGAAFAAEEIPESYTPIYTAEDLNNIRNNLSGQYILMNDIDLSVYENWEPIGTADAPFTGELDGNGYSISSMNINAECEGDEIYDFGLLGYADDGTIIKNIVIKNAKVNIKYTGTEQNSCRLALLIGYGYSAEITNCAVLGELMSKGFSITEIGGIIGRGNGCELTNCVNYASVIAGIDSTATTTSVGGIIGVSRYTTVSQCCNFGSVSTIGREIAAKCYTKMGGIEGDGSEHSVIDNVYNRGRILADFSNARTYIGGVSGESRINVNEYNTGLITYPEEFSGYAGAVSGSVYYSVLPVIGEESEMTNAYYINSDMIPAYEGRYTPSDYTIFPFNNIKLLTEDEFKNQESFAGFDFESVWMMEEGGYPVLKNQPKILLKEAVELEVGDTYDVEAKDKKWKSTDNSIAVVNEQGKIAALTSGTATVTVEYFYGYTVEYTITVPEQEEPTTAPTTEPTEPNENPQDTCLLADFWLVKILKQVWEFIKGIIVSLIEVISSF